VEIITGVERRRRWRLDEKLRIVAEAEAPGACFVEIARRHDVSRGLLWHWRRQVRSGELRPVATTSFLPLQVMPDAAVATPASVAVPASTRPRGQATADETIEITLPDGTTVRVGRAVGAVALRRVLGVLRG
jgi:transposase